MNLVPVAIQISTGTKARTYNRLNCVFISEMRVALLICQDGVKEMTMVLLRRQKPCGMV